MRNLPVIANFLKLSPNSFTSRKTYLRRPVVEPFCFKAKNSNYFSLDLKHLKALLNIKFSVKTIACFTDLAESYEQKEQFNEAVNTWQTIIGQCQHVDKILPLVSAIACLLKIGRLEEAKVFGVELVSLLESTADQIQRIKDECDLGICNLVKKFLELKMFNMIFQLLKCRFNLLKQHYNGEIKFIKIENVGVLMKNVARVVRSCDDIELFKQQYEFLDTMLLFMQNSRANEIIGKIKGKTVALFLHDYGQCCVEVKDFVKAVIICSQAIASWKITFGDESNGYKTFSHFYNTLGWALEHSCHFLEAKTAYQTSIEINEQVRDYKNEKEKNRSDSERTNNLQRIEKRLKKI